MNSGDEVYQKINFQYNWYEKKRRRIQLPGKFKESTPSESLDLMGFYDKEPQDSQVICGKCRKIYSPVNGLTRGDPTWCHNCPKKNRRKLLCGWSVAEYYNAKIHEIESKAFFIE